MKINRVNFNCAIPYKLGDSKVYPDRSLVKRAGIEYQLPAKVFKLLNALLQGNRECVSRLKLLDSVWGEHLGSDELLNNGISKLRNALGVIDPT